MAAEAIEEYLAVQGWQVQAILEGVAEAERDEGVDLDEVKRLWEQKLAGSTD